MILRNIPLTKWNDSPSWWEMAEVELTDGAWLSIFKPTKQNHSFGDHPNNWHIYYNKRGPKTVNRTFADSSDRVDHAPCGEFEAQCLLDHYMQLHGLNPTE